MENSFFVIIIILLIGIIVCSIALVNPKKTTDEKSPYHLEKDKVDELLDIFFNYRENQKIQ